MAPLSKSVFEDPRFKELLVDPAGRRDDFKHDARLDFALFGELAAARPSPRSVRWCRTR